MTTHPTDQKRLELAIAAIRRHLGEPSGPFGWFNDVVDAYGERIANLARLLATQPN